MKSLKALLRKIPAVNTAVEIRNQFRARQALKGAQPSLRADPPQRYAANLERYIERGGRRDLLTDAQKFSFNSENNATDLARFYAFCLTFDQIKKDHLKGDLAEIGVYKGHTATLLAQFARNTSRQLYLLDTFEGFSEKDLSGIDEVQAMQFADSSIESVTSFVGTENTHYIKGYFPESASQLPNEASYSLVHIDCDLYNPIKAALEYFYPRIVEGGFLIIHDYASLYWPGAEQAVDEFFADKPESVILMPDISGSVYVRKSKSTTATRAGT